MNEVQSDDPQSHYEVVTLGGGCFWCLEAVFKEIKGVNEVRTGYSGGNTPDPSYEQVCTGTTGHAEVVQIFFDPAVVSLRDILEVFFSVHDPTTLNRQGADVGTQYRSVIFYHAPQQKAVAQEALKELEESGKWDDPIVTKVKPIDSFYQAEEYHHNYYERNRSKGYCRIVIAPKLEKLWKEHRSKIKKGSGLHS